MTETKECANGKCQKHFLRRKGESFVKFNARKHCSIQCFNSTRIKTRNRYEEKREERSCVCCGKSFLTVPHREMRFCSVSCSSTHFCNFGHYAVMTQQEVADKLGLTVKQVKLIENKAMLKLRKAMQSNPVIMEIFGDNRN